MSIKKRSTQLLAVVVVSLAIAACGGKPERPPVVTSGPPPATTTVPRQATNLPPPSNTSSDSDELLRMETDPLGISEMELEAINDLQPLADIRFDFDSAVLQPEARSTLDEHADTLKTYSTMTILIEGHCDERGTVEYNLALGERRASAVYSYLTSLGIDGTRMRTISYGKEFPLDPGHDEAAWARNRRAHFEITAK